MLLLLLLLLLCHNKKRTKFGLLLYSDKCYSMQICRKGFIIGLHVIRIGIHSAGPMLQNNVVEFDALLVLY